MQHLDQERVIAIGPKAQAILTAYLFEKEETPEAYLFSPKDSVLLQKIEKRRKRKTFNKDGQVQPSQRDRSRPNASKPGDKYTKDSYNRAVERACEQAGVPKWTVNQLRHTKASEVRSRYGLDGSQVILGHAHASTSEIYAELDFEKASKIAMELG